MSKPKKKNTTNPKRKASTISNKKTRKNQPLPWWAIAVGLVLVVVVIWGAIQLWPNLAVDTASLPTEITVQQAYAKYQAGTFLLDVRTQAEWDEYHAPNTTLIPLDQLVNRLNELPKDQEIVVVCRSGNRSQQGRDTLLQAGFEQVTSMSGGLNAWRAAGYPIEP